MPQTFVPRLHGAIYRATKGRVGGSFGKTQIVLLRTTGRKSGRVRETPVIGVPDNDRVLLVGSNNGLPRHPTWFLNLQANPNVELLLGAETRRMRARCADETERAELWPRLVAVWGKRLEGYQSKTDRQLPVVVLEPAA